MTPPLRYKQLIDLVRFARPMTIIEIGTHNGKRAAVFCREALRHNENVHYVGYDLFDMATRDINKIEFNGKGAGDEAIARAKLTAIAAEHPGFSYELVKGNTRETLHGQSHCADFVFVDGGHSVETIRGDFEAIKTSRVIALDDYYSGKVDTTKCGCNTVIKDIPHIVLPRKDTGPSGGVQIVAIGYDPKWTVAMEQCRRVYNLDTISFWRNGEAVFSDMVACINTLEECSDINAAMESIFRVTSKRVFFVLKEDAIRSIAWWKETLSKYLHITEWYGHSGEVCGTGQPIREITDVKSHAAWNDEKRFDNIKANIGKTIKRLTKPAEGNMVPAHAGRVMLVCYGPSLKDTWQEILVERERRGGIVVSVSGAHDFLVERGIIPDYHVECDPRPHKAKNLDQPHPAVRYYIASCAHPDVVDRLIDYDLTLWHMGSGVESMRMLAELEDGCWAIPGGGSAGLRAWVIFYLLGYRNFSIYGMDCSFADEGKEQHAGKHFGSRQLLMDVFTADGRVFKTSAVLVAYANHFKASLQYMPDCMFEFHGDGLLQHWCQLGHTNHSEAA
jgi:uncharacterized Rossmann fold enzyme